MLSSRYSLRICYFCSPQLACLFGNGFCSVPKATTRLQHDHQARARLHTRIQARHFTIGKFLRTNGNFQRSSSGRYEMSPRRGAITKSPAYMEGIVRRAREAFGETLPTNFLSPEEYLIYERLYGPPPHTTIPEDVRQFQGPNEELVEDLEERRRPRDTLLRETCEGDWEEVNQQLLEDDLEEFAEMDGEEAIRIYEEGILMREYDDDFKARMALYKDIVAAHRALEPDETPTEEVEVIEENPYLAKEQEESEQVEYDGEGLKDLEDFNDPFGEQEGDRASRFHHLTTAGKYGTTPTTIQIPRATVANPINALLLQGSSKQLNEVARKVFGGPLLPNSTATPSSKTTHLHQQPIALNASQLYMGAMEANAYLAANIPGAYATVMSTLEEVRKRVDPGWLRGLLAKEGGPHILDAGGGGAGVLAWRELLRDEWKRLYPNSTMEENPVPVGKSTVVTGSYRLRQRVSQLLENTTFLHRLPDYDGSLDHPSIENPKVTPRRCYDIIVAPHALWSLRDDYKRKNQVRNLWSLLDPNGGILILIEKGVPRGFELVAGARELLLKYHIASPGSETAENCIGEPFEGLSTAKERGMIIAPCTNHLKCPLYPEHGANQGRKDFCHFSQRFDRPCFLQHLIGDSSRSHEDIRFSYVAVQRGVDRRQELGIPQGQAATDAAFVGYESETQDAVESSAPEEEVELDSQTPQLPFVHPLSLPRLVLPPLRRHKHVIFDLCTPGGKLERWTVPRSFSKQAYRDARKARWGDLWALGAKTRIPSNIKIGEKRRKETRGKIRRMISWKKARYLGKDVEEGEEDMMLEEGLSEKRTKRGKRETKKARPGRKKARPGRRKARDIMDRDIIGDEYEDEDRF